MLTFLYIKFQKAFSVWVEIQLVMSFKSFLIGYSSIFIFLAICYYYHWVNLLIYLPAVPEAGWCRLPPCPVGGALASELLVVCWGQDCRGWGAGPGFRMCPCLIVSWRLGLAATNGHSLEALIQHGLQNVDILILSFHLHLLAGIPWKEKLPHNYESCLATLDCKLFRKCRGYAWFFSLYLIAFKIMRWFSWSCKGDHSVFIFQLCVHKLTHFYLFLLQLLFFLLLNFGQ